MTSFFSEKCHASTLYRDRAHFVHLHALLLLILWSRMNYCLLFILCLYSESVLTCAIKFCMIKSEYPCIWCGSVILSCCQSSAGPLHVHIGQLRSGGQEHHEQQAVQGCIWLWVPGWLPWQKAKWCWIRSWIFEHCTSLKCHWSQLNEFRAKKQGICYELGARGIQAQIPPPSPHGELVWCEYYKFTSSLTLYWTLIVSPIRGQMNESCIGKMNKATCITPHTITHSACGTCLCKEYRMPQYTPMLVWQFQTYN